jgi:hypothetical protein
VDGAALMTLLTNATKQCKTWSKPKASNLPASDLCKVLANAAMTLPAPPSEVNTNSVTHIAKLHAVYAVSAARCVHQGSLVDCGANGVVAGDDVHHIKEVADHCVHVQGIDDHQLMNIHLATIGGYLKRLSTDLPLPFIISTPTLGVVRLFNQLHNLNGLRMM